MMEVAQEEAAVVNPAVVEAEVTSGFAGNRTPDEVKEKVSIARPKRTPGPAPVIEGKVIGDKVKVSDTELLQVFRIENQFLKNTQQIAALTRENEGIQKNFPEYIKSLAEKHGVDITKKLFDSTTGEFRDKP